MNQLDPDESATARQTTWLPQRRGSGPGEDAVRLMLVLLSGLRGLMR